MATDSISSTGASGIRTLESARKVSNELGKDSFLQILVAQMANQDPLSPTSDTEFIAQMAQFSALEQMQNLNASMQTQMTYSYLNKDITASYAADGEGNLYRQDVYGQVLAIVKLGGKDYLQVQDFITGAYYLVPPDQVTSVGGNTIEQLLAKLAEQLDKVVENTTPKAGDKPVEEPDEPDGEGAEGPEEAAGV